MKKFFLRPLAVLSAMAVLALTGCGKNDDSAEISIPILETSAPVYNTVTAQTGDISEKYYGEASFGISHDSYVKFSRSGQIAQINVQNGDQVKKGDVLCVLRSEDIEEQIEESDVWLKQSKETYEKLLAKNTPATELEYARIDYELQKLSREQLDRELAEYTITAPCDGQVTAVNDYERELNVNTKVWGGDWLCIVSDNSENVLSCRMLQKVDSIGYGTRAIITTLSGEVEGMVTNVREKGEGNTQTYIYEIRCDEQDLKAFNKVDVCFDVYDKEDVVKIPAKAVKTIQERKYVNLLIDGVKVEQDIETGIEDGDMVEVTNGLVGGEEIIINGE